MKKLLIAVLLVVINLPSGIGIEWIWGLLGLIVLVTAVDWFCNDSKIERLHKFR